MKLVYDDITLHPIEVVSEYEMTLDPNIVTKALNSYLSKIAGQSSKDNEWIQEKIKTLNDPNSATRPLEENLAIGESIKKRAEELSLQFDASERQGMETYIAFLRGRADANKTLFDSTIDVADQQNVSVVAMIIGAAHTEGISKLFNTAHRPFAVITPLALKQHEKKGELPWNMYERKYKKLSVFSEGFFTETLLKVFPGTTKKKPEPVLNELWFEIKATLYAYTEKIANNLLVVQNLPVGSGKVPPYGLSNDDFNFKDQIRIDLSRIQIVYDDPQKKEGRAVLFPVIFPATQTEIWIKAARGIGKESGDVESMLKKALKEVQTGKELTNKAEDQDGRVQMSRKTVAVVAPTKEKALETKVLVGQVTNM